jgi:hypothetical protein
VCFFATKAANAQALGYAAFVVANNVGDGLVTMVAGTDDLITIPGYFVGQSTGEVMKSAEGAPLHAEGVFNGYGYLRLLDTSDPANTVELDQFATENVFANPPLPGDRTMHNVVVDSGTTAYISWVRGGHAGRRLLRGRADRGRTLRGHGQRAGLQLLGRLPARPPGWQPVHPRLGP